VLVALLALVVVSGLPTAISAALDLDACASESTHADADANADEHAPADDCPDECPSGCPPFCHACACFSPYAHPEPMLAPVAVLVIERRVGHVSAQILPPSPPSPGVFHPPRPAA
jgi:hypothetical protein